jgi:general L-amino acid transport system substrate-binding protein
MRNPSNVNSRRLRGALPVLAAVLAALAGAALPGVAGAQTLKAVKDRGALACGVNEGLLGFSAPDQKGAWAGFDVDFCRAVAAAVFGDASKVRYVPLDAGERFAALQSARIDVLSRNSTWTISRETEFGLMFAGVTYYDGQGFLVRKSRNITSALELGGSKVCVQSATTTELNLKDYFRNNKMDYEPVAFASVDDTRKAYDAGRCDVLTSDVSALHAERLKLGKPDDHLILADVISKEPLGPAVRQGDDQWLNIVKWTAFAMLDAEELGVSSKTIDEAVRSSSPDVKRLVGTEGKFGEQLGLSPDWAANLIRLVGNYGEVYERNVGVNSSLAIPRGLNELWTMGGIQYAPPMR